MTKPTQEQLEAYMKALREHDWGFEYTDDMSVWTRGRDSLTALRYVQPALDPDYMIWNQFCPAEWRIRSLAVKVAA